MKTYYSCQKLWVVPFVLMCCSFKLYSGESSTPPEVTAAPGFEVSCVYTVPREEGTWVSLAVDPQGRLYAADQFGPIYRLTLQSGHDPRVEKIVATVKDKKTGKPVGAPISSAQGLLWAFDGLYVVVNGKGGEGSGLYRLRDSKSVDTLDEAELLKAIPGSGEHGLHNVTLSPDGKSIYVCGGNDCGLPEGVTSAVPDQWNGDQLLTASMQSHEWHTKNGRVPGGWVCRTGLDGKDWEIVCGGFRNLYRLAFNSQGDLFSCDNDDEWQIGMPWYRAPRVCHILSGSDFGWRNGNYIWPGYFPDGTPGIADLPKGGPSGVVFGTGAKFPAKYQEALFALDWAYGKIYAVFLKRNGATYTGTVEPFVSGKPLPATDAVIGKDGALYFIVGGRNALSRLYRVTYVGTESTAPASAPKDAAADEATVSRRKLESLHKKDSSDVIDQAWLQLDNADPAIRRAARVAIELQDAKRWQDRALKETRPEALLTAIMALARSSKDIKEAELFQALAPLDWSKLNEIQRLELIRDYGLIIIRLGQPDDATTKELAKRVGAWLPTKCDLVDRELCRLLVRLNAVESMDKMLALLTDIPSQEGQLLAGYALGTMLDGWNFDRRKLYAEWLNRAMTYVGGREVRDTVAELRKHLLETTPAGEQQKLKEILKVETVAEAPKTPRTLVKQWSMADLDPVVEKGLHDRNYERGKLVYKTADCARCHYFVNDGGDAGPDLTSVGYRFDAHSILESILEPSKVIADPFRSKMIKTKNNQRTTGRIMYEDANEVDVLVNPPDGVVVLHRADVESIVDSPVSLMPEGLVDTFNEEEIMDLIAYLISGGNKTDNMSKK